MLFQQQAIVNLQAKHTCKSHTQSPENSLYLLLNNIDLVTDSSCIRYNTSLKLYNTNLFKMLLK